MSSCAASAGTSTLVTDSMPPWTIPGSSGYGPINKTLRPTPISHFHVLCWCVHSRDREAPSGSANSHQAAGTVRKLRQHSHDEVTDRPIPSRGDQPQHADVDD